MKNIVVLISGRGSNMIAIARACREQRWDARVAAVIGHRPDAPGLEAARRLGLPVDVLDHGDWPERDRFDLELARRVEAHAPDAVALAGYMRILSPAFVRRFEGRLLNIHPSLLPAFPGLHTHRRAIEAGVKVHGATVHLVTEDLDNGPIVAQAVVPVRPDDDEASLAARVLEAEHRLYPQAVRWLVEGRLQVEGRRVCLRAASPADQPLLMPAAAALR